MKTMILIAMAMTACAVDPASTATDEQGLICDPNCDPGGQQSTVVALYNLGAAFGYQTGPAWCRIRYDEMGEPYELCSALFIDDGGNQTSIFCNDRDTVHCYWWSCGGVGEPVCHL